MLLLEVDQTKNYPSNVIFQTAIIMKVSEGETTEPEPKKEREVKKKCKNDSRVKYVAT